MDELYFPECIVCDIQYMSTQESALQSYDHYSSVVCNVDYEQTNTTENCYLPTICMYKYQSHLKYTQYTQYKTQLKTHYIIYIPFPSVWW